MLYNDWHCPFEMDGGAMRCEKCGVEIEDDSMICGKCGAEVSATNAKSADAEGHAGGGDQILH